MKWTKEKAKKYAKKYYKFYYQKNREKIKLVNKNYKLTHVQKRKEYDKKYRIKNKEKIKKLKKLWELKNPKKLEIYYQKKYLANKKNYFKNKEKILLTCKIYRQNNKEKIKIHQINYNKKIIKTPEYRFKLYKRNANRRKLEFFLTFEQFLTFWQKPCSYCGDAIETIGLDRVDNKKGYFLENVCSCCRICNRIKLKETKNFFINHCKKISRINNN